MFFYDVYFRQPQITNIESPINTTHIFQSQKTYQLCNYDIRNPANNIRDIYGQSVFISIFF